MTNDSPNKPADFDVFRLEGDVSRLRGQRFSSKARDTVDKPGGPAHARQLADQRDGPTLQHSHHDARHSQQTALKDLHAISDGLGAVTQRKITDANGPIDPRRIVDAEWPSTVGETTSPAQLAESIARARAAQQEALKQIHPLKDASSASPLPDAARSRLPDAQRVALAHAAQHEALRELRSMQDGDGPVRARALSDIEARIAKARTSQLEAMQKMCMLADALGPVDPRQLTDASGPTIYHVITDAPMPDPLAHTTPSAPCLDAYDGHSERGTQTVKHGASNPGPAVASDANPSAATAAVSDAVSGAAADQNANTAPATASDTAVNPTSASAPGSRPNLLAERMARVRAAQKETLQQLNDLDRDNGRFDS